MAFGNGTIFHSPVDLVVVPREDNSAEECLLRRRLHVGHSALDKQPQNVQGSLRAEDTMRGLTQQMKSSLVLVDRRNVPGPDLEPRRKRNETSRGCK